MNTSHQNTADYWLEMIIEHSFDREMTSLEFGQMAQLLIGRLNAMIEADKAIDTLRAKALNDAGLGEAYGVVENLLSDDPDVLAAEAHLDKEVSA